tara:strand:+ start:2208 stop:2792 length:585 start_codon:yes stop_codon:yes gene_type:complete
MYNFSTYDYKKGGGYGKSGYSPSIGKRTSGREKEVYTYSLEEEEELDDFVDDLDNETKNKISNKVSNSLFVPDTNMSNRSDRATFVSNNHFGIHESSDHTTPVMKGISPRITYRTRGNTKGPSQNAQASATYIRNAPLRRTGTQYGTSRAHKMLTDINDSPIFNMEDLMDSDNYSNEPFVKQQNRVKKVLLSLE